MVLDVKRKIPSKYEMRFLTHFIYRFPHHKLSFSFFLKFFFKKIKILQNVSSLLMCKRLGRNKYNIEEKSEQNDVAHGEQLT